MLQCTCLQLKKVTSIPVSHQTPAVKHFSSRLKKLSRVNVCTSVLTLCFAVVNCPFLCQQLREREWGGGQWIQLEPKNGILISKKFPSVWKCVHGRSGMMEGRSECSKARVKHRTEIMTFKWTASSSSWRLLVKITSHNVIRKSMGTIKVITTGTVCTSWGQIAPLFATLPSADNCAGQPESSLFMSKHFYMHLSMPPS